MSNAIYGTNPLNSAKEAFGRGFGAGAATSGINYLSDLLWQEPERSGAGGNLMAGMARGLTPQVGWMRDPRLGCGSESPFVPVLEYSSARGYQYETPQTGGSQRRKFSMWDFFKEMATGGLTGGITSVAFYGTGKGIERLKESVQSGRSVSTTPSSNSQADFYVKPDGDVVPSTGYRYMPRKASYMSSLRDTMEIPADNSGTYITFDKFDILTSGRLQVPHDASIRGSFDTMQIIDDIRIPNGRWGEANWLEPITRDFPQYGSGGATQAITNQKIKLDSLKDLLR